MCQSCRQMSAWAADDRLTLHAVSTILNWWGPDASLIFLFCSQVNCGCRSHNPLQTANTYWVCTARLSVLAIPFTLAIQTHCWLSIVYPQKSLGPHKARKGMFQRHCSYMLSPCDCYSQRAVQPLSSSNKVPIDQSRSVCILQPMSDAVNCKTLPLTTRLCRFAVFREMSTQKAAGKAFWSKRSSQDCSKW